MVYPILREWFISAWHIIHDALNYPIKPKKKTMLALERSAAKQKRLARDAQRVKESQERAATAYVPPAHAPARAYALECPHCGATCEMKKEAKNDASGCFLIIVGLLLTPVLIGIPVLIYALIHGSKVARYWRCTRCRSRFDAD